MSITKTFLKISELKAIGSQLKKENHCDHEDHDGHTNEGCGCEDKDEAEEDEDLNYWTGFED